MFDRRRNLTLKSSRKSLCRVEGLLGKLSGKLCALMILGGGFIFFVMGKDLPLLANSQAVAFEKTGKTVEVIGEYSHWVNSMCSQNCESYTVGGYPLLKPIEAYSVNDRNKVLYLRGEIVLVEELPIVAGPKANTKNASVKQKVEKILIESYQEVSLIDFKIAEAEKNKYHDKKRFGVDVTVINPLNKPLQLAVGINRGRPEIFSLRAKEKKIYKQLFDHKEYMEATYLITNKSFNERNYANQLRQRDDNDADEKNKEILIYYRTWLDFEKLTGKK